MIISNQSSVIGYRSHRCYGMQLVIVFKITWQMIMSKKSSVLAYCSLQTKGFQTGYMPEEQTVNE
jgi:hypothetical protein